MRSRAALFLLLRTNVNIYLFIYVALVSLSEE